MSLSAALGHCKPLPLCKPLPVAAAVMTLLTLAPWASAGGRCLPCFHIFHTRVRVYSRFECSKALRQYDFIRALFTSFSSLKFLEK